MYFLARIRANNVVGRVSRKEKHTVRDGVQKQRFVLAQRLPAPPYYSGKGEAVCSWCRPQRLSKPTAGKGDRLPVSCTLVVAKLYKNRDEAMYVCRPTRSSAVDTTRPSSPIFSPNQTLLLRAASKHRASGLKQQDRGVNIVVGSKDASLDGSLQVVGI